MQPKRYQGNPANQIYLKGLIQRSYSSKLTVQTHTHIGVNATTGPLKCVVTMINRQQLMVNMMILTVCLFNDRLPGREARQNSQTYMVVPLSNKHSGKFQFTDAITSTSTLTDDGNKWLIYVPFSAINWGYLGHGGGATWDTDRLPRTVGLCWSVS